MTYTTGDILNILLEHEVRETITVDTTNNTASIPSGLKEVVAERFNNWFEGGKMSNGITNESQEYIESFGLDHTMIARDSYTEQGYYTFLRIGNQRVMTADGPAMSWRVWPGGFDVSRIEFEVDNPDVAP